MSQGASPRWQDAALRARRRKAPSPLLSAASLHQEAVVLGQIGVEEKTNEIPKLTQLVDELRSEGAVVTADALHTQQPYPRLKIAISFT